MWTEGIKMYNFSQIFLNSEEMASHLRPTLSLTRTPGEEEARRTQSPEETSGFLVNPGKLRKSIQGKHRLLRCCQGTPASESLGTLGARGWLSR